MRDRLGLNRGVHRHPFQAGGLHRPGLQGHRHRRLQHLFQGVRSNAFAPAGHRRRIDRHLVLKEREAAEMLPIGVLNPALDHLLVREVVDVLQIMQPDHQPCRLGRTTDRFEEFAEALIERRPRHQPRQTHQAMAHVDDGIEALTKEIGVGTTAADRLHGKTPEIGAAGTSSRHDPTSIPAKESRRFNKLENSSGWTN